MQRCTTCGWPAGLDETCPRCRSATDETPRTATACSSGAATQDDVWEVVARFGNAAEAGYFANELEYAIGCEPRLEHCDDFDPISHFWRTSYVLSVPGQRGDLARTQLRRILDGEAIEPVSEFSGRSTGGPVPRRSVDSQVLAETGASGINWVPIVLTLAAGSLVLWAGKKAHFPRRPAAPDEALRIDVWDVLGRDQAPWVQQPVGERGVRELRIDAATGRAVLREDADGDGVFERATEYATRAN